ncbi:hypothetical protein KQX54_017878 [Cotesia glomerata]|uniref:Uncharacterized protein n=1 Tax=Cotesia glomerata TaxID=32391 RepID=A0AAV7IGB0_COTGL|nr:hypothetical protein KQX54_017878 [Cotesia glomerata]
MSVRLTGGHMVKQRRFIGIFDSSRTIEDLHFYTHTFLSVHVEVNCHWRQKEASRLFNVIKFLGTRDWID